jgi:hypothetical protein
VTRTAIPEPIDPDQGIRVVFAPADALTTAVSYAVLMRIGEHVIYHGRAVVLRGHDPMSVTDRHAEVEDPQTGERFGVLFDELEPAPPEPEGFTPAA